jgi:hypothetical protein
MTGGGSILVFPPDKLQCRPDSDIFNLRHERIRIDRPAQAF